MNCGLRTMRKDGDRGMHEGGGFVSDKMRAALEKAKDVLTVPPTEHGKFASVLQQIDDALKEPDTCTTNQVQQMIREAYQEGFQEGATQTEQIIVHAEPYEIKTKVVVETDSKMQVKPNAEVSITRHLEKSDTISDLIKADLSRSVEECVAAVNDILKRCVK